MNKVMAKMTTGMSSSLGQLVRSERLKQGLSQRELAERTGLAPSILSKLERGQQTVVRDETLKKLARGLGLDADVLRMVTRRGPNIATEPWGDDDYLVNRVVFELTNFTPSEPTQVWLVLGLLMSPDWRIRRAAITCLARAAQKVVMIDGILKALSFIAEHDPNSAVRQGAETALGLLSEPRQWEELSRTTAE